MNKWLQLLTALLGLLSAVVVLLAGLQALTPVEPLSEARALLGGSGAEPTATARPPLQAGPIAETQVGPQPASLAGEYEYLGGYLDVSGGAWDLELEAVVYDFSDHGWDGTELGQGFLEVYDGGEYVYIEGEDVLGPYSGDLELIDTYCLGGTIYRGEGEEAFYACRL